MSIPYLPRHYPPFPTLPVTLRTDSGQLGPFPALLDTGADITLAPTRWLVQVGALESEQTRLRGHFGHVTRVQLYFVGLEIEGLYFPGFYVVGDESGEELILGRDALNKLALFLDGPQQFTDVLEGVALQRLRARRAGS